ncbi:FecR family protein [Sphingomonas sanguinis]|jgi:transmembrane sensor
MISPGEADKFILFRLSVAADHRPLVFHIEERAGNRGVMEDNVRPPNRQQANKDAALWLAKIKLGTADNAAFEEWRSAHIANEIAFARALAAYEAASSDLVAAQIPQVGRRTLLRAAGSAAVALTLGAGVFTGRAYAWSTATSGVGERRLVRLPDGSGARLNTDSRLSWRFDSSSRTLWIERGEVALDLRHGVASILHGPDEKVALSAGRFNARLRGNTLDLLVMRGNATVDSRTVSAGLTPVMARAGEGLLVPSGAPVLRAATIDQLAASLAWQQGEILFEHETLGSAVEEYNRYLTRKIIIIDRDLANIPVGGRFTSDDPAAFLRALQVGLGIRVSVSDTSFLLTREKN